MVKLCLFRAVVKKSPSNKNCWQKLTHVVTSKDFFTRHGLPRIVTISTHFHNFDPSDGVKHFLEKKAFPVNWILSNFQTIWGVCCNGCLLTCSTSLTSQETIWVINTDSFLNETSSFLLAGRQQHKAIKKVIFHLKNTVCVSVKTQKPAAAWSSTLAW